MAKPKRRIPNDRLNTYARFSGIGFQMIAIIGIGVYGGMKLDERFPNDHQIFTIICSLLAIGIGLYHVIAQVNRWTK